METVIIKGHDSVEAPTFLMKTASRLFELVASGFASYSPQQSGRDKFRATVNGRNVPYRVWLRHSALLEEINRQNHGQ